LKIQPSAHLATLALVLWFGAGFAANKGNTRAYPVSAQAYYL
jgi:hypothetical protein